MAKQPKRIQAWTANREEALALAEAVAMVKSNAKAKFDESVEIAINLGVDPRHADQMVRGMVTLPSGTGKDVKVAVFARGDKAEAALAAGADKVGAEDLLEDMQNGNLDYGRVIATPDMMGLVGRIGKVLGPRGLMPNPKLGTVTFDVAKAVSELKAGKIEFRVDKAGIVHLPFGKASFGAEKLLVNANAALASLVKAKPASAKGNYVISVSVSSTMGPGIKINPLAVRTLAAA